MSNKKKNLIVISGKSNSGKTTIIKEFICNIINDFNIKDFQVSKLSNVTYQDIKGYNSNSSKLNLPSEWYVILENINNITSIGFNTAGDDRKQVEKSLKLLNKLDIVICPTKVGKRSINGSVSAMQDYIRNNSSSIEITPLFKVIYDNEKIDDPIFLDIMKNVIYPKI